MLINVAERMLEMEQEKTNQEKQEITEQKAMAPQYADNLARIERLLEGQEETEKKLLRSSRTRTFLLFVIVAVVVACAILFFTMYQSLMHTLNTLPELVASVEELATTAESDLQTIDIEAVNQTIQGVSKINFEALSQSIENLQTTTEALRSFADALSTPFNLFG